MTKNRFRAWHNPTKRMFDVNCFTDKHVFENTLDGVGTSPTNPANMEDCVLEQCTGLEDKNGNLIYEGDVITVDSSTININDTQAIVFWDEYEASFNLQWLPQGTGANALKRIKKLYKHGVGDTRWWEVKVVGNIHENPELLEDNNGK